MIQYFTIYIFPIGITHTNWVKWEEHETSLICCMKQAVVPACIKQAASQQLITSSCHVLQKLITVHFIQR